MAENREEVERMYAETFKNVKRGAIVKGRITQLDKSHALIDIGYKSEGMVSLSEFHEQVEVGDEVNVAIAQLENQDGTVVLSKEMADQLKNWEKLKVSYHKGQIIEGKVGRQVRGGYIVDVGTEAFLPVSQLPPQLRGTIRKTLPLKIIKMSDARRNVVVSHKAALESEKEHGKTELLSGLKVGQVRKGKVKNITDFGAFIDLGGMDGLLHITDISWGRVSHPSEILAVGDKVEVVILDFDLEKRKISLGIKQKTPSPWLAAAEKYPVNSKHTGRVVNITEYGTFVELEKGIEGLVHISEMSWTKRISHPSEIVAIGDMVEVVVLNLDTEKGKISLGMKQVEPSPWEVVSEKYPVGSKVKGKIRNLTDYGAFLELEKGIDGLIHISDMSWGNLKHPSELLKKGDKMEAAVLEIDPNNKRISLGLKQLTDDPWEKIGEKYHVGDRIHGKVTKVVSFGAFVELNESVEGLLHSSRLNDREIHEGDVVDVEIVNMEPQRRKIGLDMLENEETSDN